MNRLSRGVLENPSFLDYKNVRYTFDDSVSLEKLEIISTPAYVVANDGLVEWEPSYVVQDDEKRPLELSKYVDRRPIYSYTVRSYGYTKYRNIFSTTSIPSYPSFTTSQVYDYDYSYVEPVEIYSPPARQVCSNYVCFEEPTNPIQLTKRDFATNVSSTIVEEENELNVITYSSQFIFCAWIKGTKYTLLEVDGNSLHFRKGSCFFIEDLRRYACY